MLSGVVVAVVAVAVVAVAVVAVAVVVAVVVAAVVAVAVVVVVVVGVGKGVEGNAPDMPKDSNEPLFVTAIGVECRCDTAGRGDIACSMGYNGVAEADGPGRTRPAWVSRRRLSPCLTLGWVWH